MSTFRKIYTWLRCLTGLCPRPAGNFGMDVSKTAGCPQNTELFGMGGRKTGLRPRYAGPYNSWAEHKAAVEEMNRYYYEEQYGLKDSLTPGAKQLDWKTPTEFLLCPGEEQERTLQAYMGNLKEGKVF